jgi:hypothetical protein
MCSFCFVCILCTLKHAHTLTLHTLTNAFNQEMQERLLLRFRELHNKRKAGDGYSVLSEIERKQYERSRVLIEHLRNKATKAAAAGGGGGGGGGVESPKMSDLLRQLSSTGSSRPGSSKRDGGRGGGDGGGRPDSGKASSSKRSQKKSDKKSRGDKNRGDGGGSGGGGGDGGGGDGGDNVDLTRVPWRGRVADAATLSSIPGW